MDVPSVIDRAAGWAGVNLDPSMRSALGAYHDWLVAEALPAGGLAPSERPRLWTRHLADALTFAIGLTRLPAPPPDALDIGSGVGLPGIPLAIVAPAVRWHLLDRSGRRCRLMRRAVRVLDLRNVTVVEGDLSEWDMRLPFVVSRAAIPPGALRAAIEGILTDGGVAVIGASHVEPAEEPGFELVPIPATILDHAAWLRIMARP